MSQEINVCIFKLDKQLEEIKDLLGKVYEKEIEILKDKNLDSIEKNYICRWSSKNEENGFEIKEFKNEKMELKYIEAIANLEIPGMSKKNIEQLIELGNTLNKKTLTKKEQSQAIFIEFDGNKYCLIAGAKTLEGRIRSTLLETSRRKESEWGEVEFRDINGYSFIKGFYYWLISNKEKKSVINAENPINIIDIVGFESSMEEGSNFNGDGTNIDRKIPLKSIISTDGNLKSLYINLMFEGKKYSYTLHKDGRVLLYLDECGLFGEKDWISAEFLETIIQIYFKIIPIMTKEFQKQYNYNWEKYESDLKRQYSLEIILDLMEENKLTIEMIKELKEKS